VALADRIDAGERDSVLLAHPVDDASLARAVLLPHDLAHLALVPRQALLELAIGVLFGALERFVRATDGDDDGGHGEHRPLERVRLVVGFEILCCIFELVGGRPQARPRTRRIVGHDASLRRW
jgi:hypothetical protein